MWLALLFFYAVACCSGCCVSPRSLLNCLGSHEASHSFPLQVTHKLLAEEVAFASSAGGKDDAGV